MLVGGSANLKGIAEFAKKHLGVAARVGKATGFGGVADDIDKPQYATAVGLMLIDAESAGPAKAGKGKKVAQGDTLKQAGGFLKNIFGKLKA